MYIIYFNRDFCRLAICAPLNMNSLNSAYIIAFNSRQIKLYIYLSIYLSIYIYIYIYMLALRKAER